MAYFEGEKNETKRKTRTLMRTLDPDWNQQLHWEVNEAQIDGLALIVELWDWDRFSSDDSLGAIRLPVATALAECSGGQVSAHRFSSSRKSLYASWMATVDGICGGLTLSRRAGLSKVLTTCLFELGDPGWTWAPGSHDPEQPAACDHAPRGDGGPRENLDTSDGGDNRDFWEGFVGTDGTW